MRTLLIVAIVLVASAAGLRAQDLLSTAKDQYASAAYEDALATLGRVESDSSPDVARQVDEYRTFCLFALGRTREAEALVESIVRKDPLARLLASDASPRLEAMFNDIRKRVLPSLIRDRFRLARSEVEQQNLAGAEPLLLDARLLIAEANRMGVADPSLGDLSVLVDGFLQLIRTTKEVSATAPPAATPAVVDVAAAPVSLTPPRVAPPAPQSPKVYSIEDAGVIPPVALEQSMPALTWEMKRIARSFKASGVLSVLIDETGHVVEARINQSMNPALDGLILNTARQWKYVPAKKDGVPVRYLKMLTLVP
jgi:hypothetical protein